jgi:molybdopterin converting factor subunit 1
MAVRVLFFAGARERIGAVEIAFDISPGERLGSFLDTLCARYPSLATLRASSFVAVNQMYAGPETLLHDGDEVAWIPPVSGG